MSSETAFDRFMELLELRQNVRYGHQPHAKHQLQRWSQLEQSGFANLCNCRRRKVYHQQFRLLIDTIGDELVNIEWRRLCVRQILYTLQGLQSISHSAPHKERLLALEDELYQICQYALPTIGQQADPV